MKRITTSIVFKFSSVFSRIKFRGLLTSKLMATLFMMLAAGGCSSENIDLNGLDSPNETSSVVTFTEFPSLTTAAYKSVFKLKCSLNLKLSDLSTFIASKPYAGGLGGAHVEYMFCLDIRGDRDRSLLEAHRILQTAEFLDNYYSEQAVVMAASYLAEVNIGTAADTAMGSNYLLEKNLPPFPTTEEDRKHKMALLKRNRDFYLKVFVEKKR